ncbi:M16 family metallopeptidase [Phenylobacterium immobile]|uniref:M16 family metallopeptidase n=1 Tax=Phenylobacterium immobile TaxID=21 RepID=UPI000A7407B6|nr:M16 family metallopeptidase [Phenylobacterium immobile]
MTSSTRPSLLRGVALLTIAVLAMAQGPSSAQARTALPSFKVALPRLGKADKAPAVKARLAPGQWPQALTNLKADPLTVFGALPNGMRYAIRRQPIPAGQAAIRLRFDVGSLDETDSQQGLAHFLEHMAFNGSSGVGENEMIKILERKGLAFGADTNATTNFSATTYRLDLPHTDNETVDTALMLMRETADALTLDPAAIDRERGVVLSEERASDTPGFRIYKARLDFLLKGQRPPTRYPIGQVEVLKTASAGELRALYDAYYRPERAVLIIAGDFDPVAIEAKIKAKFADWRGRGAAGVEPDLGAVAKRDLEARLVVEAGAPLSLQIAWLRPMDLRADSVETRREDLIAHLGLAVLNRRLSALARSGEPPFLGAGAFTSDQQGAAEMTMLTVNAEPDRWRVALAAVDQEQRRIVRYGVRQDELDREIEEFQAVLKAAVSGAATRRPSDLAGEILGSLEDDEVVTDPATDLALYDQVVKGLKAETVSEAVKAAFEGSGPLLFMASPQAVPGGEAAVLAEYQTVRKSDVDAPKAAQQTAWPYETFGDPGTVAETREVADLDTVFVRFANGVRLTIKPTKFRDDEVLVRVNIGDGIVGLPKDRSSLNWTAGAFTEGGLKQIDNESMERVLASKVYGVRFGMADDALVLSGGTRRDDLETQLQVLAAFVVEPGWRAEAFQRIKGGARTMHDQFEATDSGVLSRDLAGLLHSGDGRWAFPSRDEMAKVSLADLRKEVDPQIAAGPIEVVIVGDIGVETATDLVARTFGALPPRRPATAPSPTQLDVRFPAPPAQPVTLEHKGRGDQAIGLVAWPTTGFYANPQLARDTAVMGEVLRLRLLDDLREAQGATYSPSVNYQHSTVWPAWGYMSASVEVPPAKLEEFFADVSRISADLRDKPITADELARAKTPRLDSIEKARVTNQYWLAELSRAQTDPRRLDLIRQFTSGTERVTAADVQKAAQTYLKDERAYRLTVRPKSSRSTLERDRTGF